MTEKELYRMYAAANKKHMGSKELSHYAEFKSMHPCIENESFVTDFNVNFTNKVFSISLHPIYSLPNYHTHSVLEIMYAVNGNFINVIEGEKTELHPGDFCFIPPGVYHSLDALGDDQSKHYLLNICISAENGNETFEELRSESDAISAYIRSIFQEPRYPKYAMIKCGDFDNLNRLVLLLHSVTLSSARNKTMLFNCAGDISKTNTFSVSKRLLHCAISYAALTGKTVISPIATKTAIPAAMILKYIQTHYRTVTLETLSEKYSYSFSHTSRLIKQLTGVNFSKILTKTRIEEACRLLSATKHSISEIASQTGYGSVEHFTRTFHSEVGMSPTEYRKVGGK